MPRYKLFLRTYTAVSPYGVQLNTLMVTGSSVRRRKATIKRKKSANSKTRSVRKPHPAPVHAETEDAGEPDDVHDVMVNTDEEHTDDLSAQPSGSNCTYIEPEVCFFQ